jgi:hypothetical protein
MLFRTSEGNFVEIKKYDFVNDKIYYNKIFQLKKEIYNKFYISVSKSDNNKHKFDKSNI